MSENPKLTKDQKKYLELRAEERKLGQKAETLRKKIAKTCQHPITEPYVWEHDNGYGRQRKINGKWCTICRARKYYENFGEWKPEADW